MKKILIVGETLEIGRTEEIYGRKFTEYGIEVKHFSWKDAIPTLSSQSFINKVARRLAWQNFANIANQELLKIAGEFQPDLTLVISPLMLNPSSILSIKQNGLIWVFFTDNPLDAHHTHTNSWVKKGLPLWDKAFIWSNELVNSLIKVGVKDAYFHPFCTDTKYHFPQRESSPSYDVAFIGNWDASRKREKYLKSISEFSLGLWGSSYWNTHCQEPSLQGLCQGMCSYQQIPRVLGSAKIGLNILRPQNEGGHNIRTYEIPASGTLMLSERSDILMDLFIEDQEAVYFSNPDELRKKVQYLLENTKIATTIAEAGYQKAIQNTISERVSELLSLYQISKSTQHSVVQF